MTHTLRLTILALVALLLVPVDVASQQVRVRPRSRHRITAHAGMGVRVDMTAAERATVTYFELKIDAGAPTTVTTPLLLNNTRTTTGHNSYRLPLPVISAGSHTVQVRACNATGCSAYTTAVTFTYEV